jgi:hypothetical protein
VPNEETLSASKASPAESATAAGAEVSPAPAVDDAASTESERLRARLLPGYAADTLEVPEFRDKRLTEGKWSHEESLRGWLAGGFTVLFAITVIWVALSASCCNKATWTNVKEAIQIILPAETALLGSAVGFYFGAKKS